ncbi:unnamed protein product [Pipistrellus nathusii]|uniref:Basic proline-rich protein-like n=1 Tax=Pipistrellus nathusii TaxID=59473 RepID=A0ABN9ZXQ1_PIPNA
MFQRAQGAAPPAAPPPGRRPPGPPRRPSAPGSAAAMQPEEAPPPASPRRPRRPRARRPPERSARGAENTLKMFPIKMSILRQSARAPAAGDTGAGLRRSAAGVRRGAGLGAPGSLRAQFPPVPPHPPLCGSRPTAPGRRIPPPREPGAAGGALPAAALPALTLGEHTVTPCPAGSHLPRRCLYGAQCTAMAPERLLLATANSRGPAIGPLPPIVLTRARRLLAVSGDTSSRIETARKSECVWMPGKEAEAGEAEAEAAAATGKRALWSVCMCLTPAGSTPERPPERPGPDFSTRLSNSSGKTDTHRPPPALPTPNSLAEPLR